MSYGKERRQMLGRRSEPVPWTAVGVRAVEGVAAAVFVCVIVAEFASMFR